RPASRPELLLFSPPAPAVRCTSKRISGGVWNPRRHSLISLCRSATRLTIGIGGFLCPSVFAGQGRNVAKPAQKSAQVPQASEPSRSRLNQGVQQGAGAATCGLRKAPGAHIRRRVINAFEPVAQSV